jgi:hypothetical protein
MNNLSFLLLFMFNSTHVKKKYFSSLFIPPIKMIICHMYMFIYFCITYLYIGILYISYIYIHTVYICIYIYIYIVYMHIYIYIDVHRDSASFGYQSISAYG